ncbi:hypothetical protein M7I_5785 [Glarea lozoyensis 74030]|uniref:Uncharacterized protein n=1 Tax=Glarea lozoyensis (strain ATCC 74030 / MF5533) TaxID=1104152 RepID=H0EST8_GLAL7|nr:hypothetical protein M7I_5785 [Glarea lozoyensis 74030]
MSPNGGDNNFSDDDFDDLPNDYLAELEHNAIQFTQAQTQPRVLKQPAAVNAAPSSDYGDDIDDEDLDDAVVIDESRSTPAIIPNLQREHTSQAVQREQFRQQRYGNATAGNAYANNGADRERSRMPPPPMFSQPIPQGSRTRKPENDSSNTFGSQPAASQHGADALQKQIEDLLKERDALKSDLNAKTGEIAIVRSKQEKTVKQYEREMLAMRKLNEEKISKQEKALEAAKTAEKNAATERDFLKQDLAEESERVRKLNKAETSEKLGANLTTPKKKKALAHRDGFDDEEIEFLSPSKVSPSKFQKRLMGSPSKAGAKRKRKAVESPIAALEVMQDDTAAGAADVAEGRDFILDESILAGLSMQDDRFDVSDASCIVSCANKSSSWEPC